MRSHDGVNCENPTLGARVASFELDVYEVSVGRFRAFLDAGQGLRGSPPRPGAGAHPGHPDSGWDPAWSSLLLESRASLDAALDCGPGATWTASPGAHELLPINCLNFAEAAAFCAWDGGFLPTEAERNYVASGGDEQRVFPWSTPPESTHIGVEYAVYGSPGTAAVGSHRAGDGRWGHADLAGNVWEWTLDTVELAKVLPTEGAAFCEPAGMPVPCDDCLATGVGTARVLRGGGWGLPDRGMAVSIRRGGEPSERHHVFGVRCARPLTGAAIHETGCVAACEARTCGDDGCGGSCGSCDGAQACVEGRCALVDYAPGPFGAAVGETLANLRLSVIPDATRDVDALRVLDLGEYYRPTAGGILAIYLTTGWATPDHSVELFDRAKAASDVELVIVLLEGERRGQPADVGNVQEFARSRALAVPVGMDTLANLPGPLRDDPRPQLVLVNRATMKIRAIRAPLGDGDPFAVD